MMPFSHALGHLVWVQVWQVTLVALAVGVVTRLCCRRRPHLAHLLWMLVLVKCLTPPIWSSPTGVFSWTAAVFAPPTRAELAGDGLDEFLRLYGAQPGKSPIGDGEQFAGISRAQRAPLSLTPRQSASPAPQANSPWPRGTVAMGLVWLAGAIVCAAVMSFSTCRLWRRICRVQLPVDVPLANLAGRLRQSLNVSDRVRLIVVPEQIGPLAFGWVRPTVVLPRGLVSSCSIDDLEPLVAHELMHVRRRDGLVALFQLVVQCLWWFHPLVWWANRRIVQERERCCDEAVIGGLGWQPGRYARGLLAVLEWKSQARWLAPVPGIRLFEINRQRLEHLMRHPGQFHVSTPRGYWLLLAVGLLLVVPGAGPARTADGAAAGVPQAASADDRREPEPAIEVAVESPVVALATSDDVKSNDAKVEDQAAPQGPVYEIYAMNAGGTGARRVASIPGYPIINSPEISPDGKWVAVDGWKADKNLHDAHLLFVHIETGKVRDLGIGAMPTWSADGRWIAYSKYGPEGGVFIREVDGDNQRLIDPDGWGIQWSPDGYKLAYTHGGNILVYDFIADTLKEIFPPGDEPYNSIYWNCKWSPDSKRICFKGRRHDKTIDIAIVSVVGDAPKLRVCCDGTEYNEDIGWHPDGARITLPRVATSSQPSQIYEFNPDKNDPPKLLVGQPADRNNSGMCWSRDGKTLYFISQK